MDLSGWEFSDGIEYTFPGGVSIPPGGYVVVGHDPATVEAVYGISGVLGPFESGRLSIGGERVAIEDAGGTLVDEVTCFKGSEIEARFHSGVKQDVRDGWLKLEDWGGRGKR